MLNTLNCNRAMPQQNIGEFGIIHIVSYEDNTKASCIYYIRKYYICTCVYTGIFVYTCIYIFMINFPKG